MIRLRIYNVCHGRYEHAELGKNFTLKTVPHMSSEDCYTTEWQQSTGFIDRNGIEIYEGDTVRRLINSRGKLYPSNYKKNVIVVQIKNGLCNIRKQSERYEII